jgi:hypothetical protein
MIGFIVSAKVGSDAGDETVKQTFKNGLAESYAEIGRYRDIPLSYKSFGVNSCWSLTSSPSLGHTSLMNSRINLFALPLLARSSALGLLARV